MGLFDLFKSKTVDVWVDNNTNLMWQLDIENYGFSWDDANIYVKTTNVAKYAGYDNWRLATIEELEWVYKYKNLDVAWKYKEKGINVTDFSQAFYWSSSMLKDNLEKATDLSGETDIENKVWNICATNAMAGYDPRSDKQRVRLVRNRS